jgi:hypothetical protein
MQPSAPPELLGEIEAWDSLTQGQRADVGRALRRLSWTYGEICQALGVAKGTLAGWCRDITLDDNHRAQITARRPTPRDTQRKRRQQVEEIRAKAWAFAEGHMNDPLFVAGTVLYWAEGAKTAPRLALTNTDAAARVHLLGAALSHRRAGFRAVSPPARR